MYACAKDVIGARARFPKPMGPYKILLAFGPNLVASEGDEWKRQRKLVAPAFSEVRPLPSISIFLVVRRARRGRTLPIPTPVLSRTWTRRAAVRVEGGVRGRVAGQPRVGWGSEAPWASVSG